MNQWEAEKTIIEAPAGPAKTEKPQPKQLPTILFLTGAMAGQSIKLEAKDYTFGRNQEALICINDPTISRIHAKMIHIDGKYRLIDNNSTNGTFIDDERVCEVELNEGMKIRLGRTVIFKFTKQDELEEKVQDHLFKSATLDFLTQVHNKGSFLSRLSAEMKFSIRMKTIFTLVIFDIDHFKKINDTHGHQAGDYVLKTLAQLIRRTIRTEDFFARYGGEEFVLILRGIDEERAYLFSERIRKVIAHYEYSYSGTKIPVAISIGLATQVDNAFSDEDSIIKAADEFLYMAKRSGRNRVCCKSRPA